MARAAKKDVALTPKEKLAQALVPEAEQPYQVPKNWCWIFGKAVFSPMEVKKPSDKVFRYIDIDAIDNKRQVVTSPKLIDVKDAPSRASRALHAGDTVFSMVRPYLKNIAFIDESIEDSIASTGFYICTPNSNVDPKYNYYMMISPYVVDGLNAFMKGDNSPSIRKDDIEQFPYPIPPLAEQQRIVDRIESLFAKLDEAKEKAQAVVDGFEDRKAAILHKAFTGALTKQWRESRGLSISSWDALPFGELAKDVRLGLVRGKVEQATDKQYGYLKMNNITTDGLVDLDGLVRVDATIDEVLTYSLYPGDFLFNTRNSFELVGKNAVWQFSEVNNMLFNNNIMRVRFHNRVLPQFVCHFFNSAEGKRDLEKVKKNTTNIAAIYAKDLI